MCILVWKRLEQNKQLLFSIFFYQFSCRMRSLLMYQGTHVTKQTAATSLLVKSSQSSSSSMPWKLVQTMILKQNRVKLNRKHHGKHAEEGKSTFSLVIPETFNPWELYRRAVRKSSADTRHCMHAGMSVTVMNYAGDILDAVFWPDGPQVAYWSLNSNLFFLLHCHPYTHMCHPQDTQRSTFLKSNTFQIVLGNGCENLTGIPEGFGIFYGKTRWKYIKYMQWLYFLRGRRRLYHDSGQIELSKWWKRESILVHKR